MIRIQESFGAKLLSALLGTVGLLLVVTFLVVRVEMTREVEAVTERTVRNAGTLFEELNELQRQQTARLAGPFTDSPRARARLDAIIVARDSDGLAGGGEYEQMLQELAGEVEYEMLFADLTDVVLVFTDAWGEPFLSLVRGERITTGDPVGVVPLAELVLGGDRLEARGYRVVDGNVYNVHSLYVQLASRPIGTVTFGLPIDSADVERIGRVGGFEACFFVDGQCAVRTPGVGEELGASMLAAARDREALRTDADGTAWSIRSEPLTPERPDEGLRIVAVPLDEVLAPFDSIQRALLLGGGGALLLSVLLGAALSRSLTRPVKALVAAAGRVAEGDYEAEVSVASRDEMGTLAKAFNEMTRGLLLRERYRAVLNKVVSQDVAEELMRGEVDLGGENREVTVLFADIRGFTPLTEGMEPQQVIGLLNDCMEHLSQAVDAEGGVVDKFIGDELMAVFGAPVTQSDHALRAVTAAVRMRDGMARMNAERASRGEAPLGIGIGINTGVAVAGNMGASDRLNYTVLGTTVNLASRLTGVAQPGEILISGPSLAHAGSAVVAPPAGERALKGFSSEVEVYAVQRVTGGTLAGGTPPGGAPPSGALPGGATESGAARPGTAATAGGAAPTLLLSLALSLAAATGLSAQHAGLGYISQSGAVQIDLTGQVDLETFLFFNDEPGLSGLAYGSGLVFAPRIRVFTDVFLGDHVYGLVELRGQRGEAPSDTVWEGGIEQAYIRLSDGSGAFGLQGGLFASPFGSYAQRHLSEVDPFIRPPLPYDHRTVISRTFAAPNAGFFREWRDDAEQWRPTGAPPVWGVPYQWGAMASAAAGALTLRLAAMNSAPSSEPREWFEPEVVEDVSWIWGLQARLTPELAIGASYNHGPYMWSSVPNAPADTTGFLQYDQSLVAADVSFARGPFMVRGEVIRDVWDVVNVAEDAVELGYTAEAQMDVAAGWSAALRWGKIDYQEVGGADWDWDVSRYEGSLGYRIILNAGVLASYAVTRNDGPVEVDDDLLAVRLWWAF